MLTLGWRGEERKSCPVSWGSIKEWPLLPLHRPEETGWEGLRPRTHHQELGCAGAGPSRRTARQAGPAGWAWSACAPLPQAGEDPGDRWLLETGLLEGNRWKEENQCGMDQETPLPEGLPPRLSPTLAFSPEGSALGREW